MIQYIVAALAALVGGACLFCLVKAVQAKAPLGPPGIGILISLLVGGAMWYFRAQGSEYDVLWPWPTIYLIAFAVNLAAVFIGNSGKGSTSRSGVTMVGSAAERR
jgi:hypothetical protein